MLTAAETRGGFTEVESGTSEAGGQITPTAEVASEATLAGLGTALVRAHESVVSGGVAEPSEIR